MQTAATTIHMALMLSPRWSAMPPTAQAPTSATRIQNAFRIIAVREASPRMFATLFPRFSWEPPGPGSAHGSPCGGNGSFAELARRDAGPVGAEQPAVAQLGL